MEHTKVWAHRGASGYAMENTLEAFELAVEQGADGVELDVQICKSGELVVIHDETIDRVTSNSGMVKNLTLDELKEYSKGNIPTLEEVYRLLRPTDLVINTELKTGIVLYPDLEVKVLKLASELEMEERIWYSSFYHPSICKIKELSTKSRTGLLYSDGWIGIQQYASQLHVGALHPAYYHLQDEEYMGRCKEYGLNVHVWTVNEEKDMIRICGMGTDAIITNYPDIARKVVDKYC